MGRPSKSHQPTPAIRVHFADNVRRLRDRVFADRTSETDRNKALAKAARTSLSQVQRIVDKKSGPSIDALERFAAALQCRPQDLVTPYFAYQGVTEPQDRTDPAPGSSMFSDRRAG